MLSSDSPTQTLCEHRHLPSSDELPSSDDTPVDNEDLPIGG